MAYIMLHCAIYCISNTIFIYLSLHLHIYARIQFCDLWLCLCYKMNCRWDIALVCEMCHKQHYAIMPKNFFIFLPLALEENVLLNIITDEVLDQMFLIYSITVRRAIRNIIGEEFLCPSALMFFYLS